MRSLIFAAATLLMFALSPAIAADAPKKAGGALV